MSIVTQLPNVSAQTRAFISGRSKGTWYGDLYMQTGGRGTAGKGREGGKRGGWEYRWLYGRVYKQMRSFGLKTWTG